MTGEAAAQPVVDEVRSILTGDARVQTVCEVLSMHLGPQEILVAATLDFRDVRVDLASQRAERAGQPLSLTAKEYALLAFFLRHAGQVLSRTRIYEHVWDERYDGLSNTLEVHVKELRRKLEMHGPRLIHTLRGRGYLLGDAPDVQHQGEDR